MTTPTEIEPHTALTRRFASIAIPGITQPELVDYITLPQPPENPPTSQTTSVQRTNPHNARYQQELRARARERERLLSQLEIEEVRFNLFTTEEIDEYAVVNINNSNSDGPNSVRDLRMGPHNDSEICETCSKDLIGCTGHFGKIVLPKFMHPLSINHIILVLSCVCNSCGSLLVTRSELERANIIRMSGVRRLQGIKELVKTLKRHCQKTVQDPLVEKCEPNPVYASVRENKGDYRLAYTYPGSDKKKMFFRTPDEIYGILNSISDNDANLLGFMYGSHPRTMIIERLIVAPYCARPDVYQGDRFFPDDLTTMYSDIVSTVHLYMSPGINEAEKERHLNDLYFKVSHFMKNDGLYSQGGVKVYSDVTKRIQGKSAIIRNNIMGKRVNYAGRTVVGPGSYLRVDEVGIPRLMAKRLTRPVIVSEMNRQELQAKYDMGQVVYITPHSDNFAGSLIPVEQHKDRYPDYRLQLGDEVGRMLEDGDIVLINRQPTLHKQNILALKVVIIDDRIIRINLSITTPLNADFDGDEVNVHVPQTIEAYAEAEQLLSVFQNLMSAQTNKPMMGIVYDSLTGAYLLTYYENEYETLEKDIADLRVTIENTDPSSEEYGQLSQSMSVKILRKAVVDQKRILDPIVFEQALLPVADAPQILTLQDRLNRYGVPWGSGRALFSATLPEDFDYNAKGVLIKEGVLLKGVLGKKTLGNVDGSIIAEMFKQLGGLVTVDFMSDVQFVLREFLSQRGFSVGIDDCIPDEPAFRELIQGEINAAMVRVLELSGKTTTQIAAEQRERKIMETLDITKALGDRVVREALNPENALVIMANSGAKGTTFNLAQISSLLGQTKVSGRRIPANLPGNRALPVFEPNDPDPRARGFCYNSFSTGLEPSEFFFHAQGGREGLTDTAINTAQTGSLQHQLIKSAEDVNISSDYSVRTPNNDIVQFVYGDDGFDASELGSITIHGENVPFFRNIFQLADRINRIYQPINATVPPQSSQDIPVLEPPEISVQPPVEFEQIVDVSHIQPTAFASPPAYEQGQLATMS